MCSSDLSDAMVFLMKTYSEDEHVNVGSGDDVTIAELAAKVCAIAGLSPDIRFDRTKPDGTPRKLMSADKIRALGWSPKISLDEGLRDAFDWYLAHRSEARS